MSRMIGVKGDQGEEFGKMYKEMYYKNLTVYKMAKQKTDKIKC